MSTPTQSMFGNAYIDYIKVGDEYAKVRIVQEDIYYEVTATLAGHTWNLGRELSFTSAMIAALQWASDAARK